MHGIRESDKLIRHVFTVCAAIGVLLLLVNITGVLVPDMRAIDNMKRKNDSHLSYGETVDAFDALAGQVSDAPAFFTSVNKIVHDRMTNPAADWVEQTTAMRVRLTDNWLIYGLSFYDTRLAYYQHLDADRALARGIGMCGEQAIAVARLIERAGFDSGIVGTGSHITAWARTGDGALYILDPDFGGAYPASVAADAVAATYAPALAAMESASMLPYLLTHHALVGQSDLVPARDLDPSLYGPLRVIDMNPILAENIAYGLKWLIPFAFIMAGVGGHMWRRSRSKYGPAA